MITQAHLEMARPESRYLRVPSSASENYWVVVVPVPVVDGWVVVVVPVPVVEGSVVVVVELPVVDEEVAGAVVCGTVSVVALFWVTVEPPNQP
jgi:hypothetical protein